MSKPRLPARNSVPLLTAFLLAAPGTIAAAERGVGIVDNPIAPKVVSDAEVHTVKQARRPRYTRMTKDYQTPDVSLINASGETIALRKMLDCDEAVLMQFVFTTCATICPVLSASFASAQDELRASGYDFRMVSISIDPEQDTPRTLSEFASRFKAGEQWHFLTGPRDSVARVQKAFDAYYPGNNKMYHQPFTFIRAKNGAPWVRIDGMMSSKELVAEFRRVLGLDIPIASLSK